MAWHPPLRTEQKSEGISQQNSENNIYEFIPKQEKMEKLKNMYKE